MRAVTLHFFAAQTLPDAFGENECCAAAGRCFVALLVGVLLRRMITPLALVAVCVSGGFLLPLRSECGSGGCETDDICD